MFMKRLKLMNYRHKRRTPCQGYRKYFQYNNSRKFLKSREIEGHPKYKKFVENQIDRNRKKAPYIISF